MPEEPAPAPLADTSSLPAVIPTHATQLPAQPYPYPQMPGGPYMASPRKRPTWMYAVAGGLLVIQLFAPHQFKPTTILGGVFADWTLQVTSANVQNQLLLAKSQKLAESIAQLEADYADKRGKCSLVGLFGPDAYKLCMIAADQYYVPALQQARAQLADIEADLGKR